MTAFACHKLRAYRQLGVQDCLRVALYRLLKRGGYYRLIHQPKARPIGEFFQSSSGRPLDLPSSIAGWLDEQRKFLLEGRASFFSGSPREVGSPPYWNRNYLGDGLEPAGAELKHWSDIPDFDPGRGDIKVLWELSRFHWAPVLALCARGGDMQALRLLNEWIADWCAHNPFGLGPQWKCAQEASLRALSLVLSLQLGRLAAGPALEALLEEHAFRISSAGFYGRAQRNNHSTNEALGLWVLHAWLGSKARSEELRRDSLRQLTRLRKSASLAISNLFASDGGFSQRSTNYHRLALDVATWSRAIVMDLGCDDLDELALNRLSSASTWLRALCDPPTGDAPNFGANDGAFFNQFAVRNFRDFRPSVLAAEVLSSMPNDTGKNRCELVLCALGQEEFGQCPTLFCRESGYIIDNEEVGLKFFFHVPRFSCRPGHADVLHVDVWWKGVNVLVDSGTYSYAADPELIRLLPGTGSHNTVMVDGLDQFPRIGRFLFAPWSSAELTRCHSESVGIREYCGVFRSTQGYHHEREVVVGGKRIIVTDRLSGLRSSARLAWHLGGDGWLETEHGARCDSVSLSVEGPGDLSFGVDTRSRRYLERESGRCVVKTAEGTSVHWRTIIELF